MAGKKGQLGGLFVELGFKGQPLLKGLDVAAGKFLLVKNAVTQASSMIDSFVSKATSRQADFNKISLMTGFTPEQLKKWREWEHINNVTEGTVAKTYANIRKMQELARQNKGWQNLPLGYQKFHISPFQSPEAIVKQFQKIAKQQGMSAIQQTTILEEMGITPEFIALLDGVNSRVDESTHLTQAQSDALVELNRDWVTLTDTMGNIGEVLSAKVAPQLSAFINKLTDLSLVVTQPEKREEVKKDVKTFVKNYPKLLEEMLTGRSRWGFAGLVLQSTKSSNALRQSNQKRLEQALQGDFNQKFFKMLGIPLPTPEELRGIKKSIPVKNAKPAPQLETIKDMKDAGFYNPGLPLLPDVGGSNTINDNRQFTNNVTVTVNGADVDKNNLQYTLLDNINNATNLNAISDYSRRNRDDL